MNAPSTTGQKAKQTAFAAFVLVTCIYALCHTTSISFAIVSLSMALIAGWVTFIIWAGKNQPPLRNTWLITQLILVIIICWPHCGLSIYWLAGGLLLSTIRLTKKHALPGINAFHPIIYWKESQPALRRKIEIILGTSLDTALPIEEVRKNAQALGQVTEEFLSEAS